MFVADRFSDEFFAVREEGKDRYLLYSVADQQFRHPVSLDRHSTKHPKSFSTGAALGVTKTRAARHRPVAMGVRRRSIEATDALFSETAFVARLPARSRQARGITNIALAWRVSQPRTIRNSHHTMTTENLTAAAAQADQADYFTRVNWHIDAAAERARQAKAGIDSVLAEAKAKLERVHGREAEQRLAEQRIQRLEVMAAAADQHGKEIQAQARDYAARLSRDNTPISREEAQTFWQKADQISLQVLKLHEDARNA